MMPKIVNLIGEKFGRLEVVSQGPNNKHGQKSWNCSCDCGNTKTVITARLLSGHTRSCGCLIGGVVTHGNCLPEGYTREYRVWRNIKNRCLNPNVRGYADYGGRGITICQRWENSFENFLEDMGPCPPGHTIERIKNHLGYFPNNCKWATSLENNQNKRNCIYLTAFEATKVQNEWARELGCSNTTIRFHRRKGRSMEWIVEHFRKNAV